MLLPKVSVVHANRRIRNMKAIHQLTPLVSLVVLAFGVYYVYNDAQNGGLSGVATEDWVLLIAGAFLVFGTTHMVL
jgi:hypothetical protein